MYSASSTAEEVTQGIDGTGLAAIVTGASSGIGVETARVLALRGVHVVMAVRNMDAGRNGRDITLDEVSNAKIDVMELDLSSLASVRKFALEYKSLGLPLNILINNAGVFLPKIMFSKDNLELHFATNHLGHFLLIDLLVDTVKRTASQSQVEGRIINVASMAQNYLFLNDIQFDKTSNNPLFEYPKSKLANVLCANELGRRLKEEGVGITVNSLHPGMIPTNIFRES